MFRESDSLFSLHLTVAQNSGGICKGLSPGGHFVSVIAYCRLQRVLRILVKNKGNRRHFTAAIIMEQIAR